MAAQKSALTKWMERNYSAGMAARGFDWEPVLARCVSEGVTDGSGRTASLRILRAAFRRVHWVRTGARRQGRPATVKREIRRSFQRSAA